MSRIASSCENCVFGNKFPSAPKPKTLEDLRSEMTSWQRFWSNDIALRFEAAHQKYAYDDFINYRICGRFPQFVKRHKDDLCGEHQAADRQFEFMTEEELIEGLEKLLK